MSYKVIQACITLILSIYCLNSTAAGTPWSYSGLNGPAYWAKLDSAYALCGKGSQQSPVDVSITKDDTLPAIEFNYSATGNQIENNGHIIEINYKPGSSIFIENVEYELVQSHFHTPAEHTINKTRYAMEVQHVHRSKAGQQLRISVLYITGEDSKALHHSWLNLLSARHTRHLLYKTINPIDLLPDNKDYYRLAGSSTMPPCTENIIWIIMKNPATATREQILELRKTIHTDNNRPVQPLNNRTILE